MVLVAEVLRPLVWRGLLCTCCRDHRDTVTPGHGALAQRWRRANTWVAPSPASPCPGKLLGHRRICPLHSIVMDIRSDEIVERACCGPLANLSLCSFQGAVHLHAGPPCHTGQVRETLSFCSFQNARAHLYALPADMWFGAAFQNVRSKFPTKSKNQAGFRNKGVLGN